MSDKEYYDRRGRSLYQERKAQDPEWWARRKEQSRKVYYSSWEGRLTHLLSLARYRSKRKGLEVTVTRDQLLHLVESKGFRCARTNLPLSIDRQPKDDPHNPWAPSLDRINPSLGYTPENVQIVCLMYNQAKNMADDQTVRIFADALLRGYAPVKHD